MPFQIVIEVQAGCVQRVFCSDPAAEVFVVDQGEFDPLGSVAPASVALISPLPAHELAGSDIEAAIEAACNAGTLQEPVAC